MVKILVIDDERLVRDTIARALRSRGYEPLLAEHGQRGLDLVRDEEPQLVITDIIMPEKEGIETIRELRRARPATRIIAMSGGGRIGNVDFLSMALKLGADAILHKPFDAAQLADCIQECLAAA